MSGAARAAKEETKHDPEQQKLAAYQASNLEAAALVLECTEKYGGEEAFAGAVGQACLAEARDDRSK